MHRCGHQVDRSRTVAGKPTSLLDLGYNHVGLDGGWNYCYPNNKTFHQVRGRGATSCSTRAGWSGWDRQSCRILQILPVRQVTKELVTGGAGRQAF